MRLDPKKAQGGWQGSSADLANAGIFIDGLRCYHDGTVCPGQSIPAHLVDMDAVVPDAPAPRVAPEPKYDDPGYAPDKKPKVYLTQMNMRQLRAECVDLDIPFTPGDKKKALIAKIREARK